MNRSTVVLAGEDGRELGSSDKLAAHRGEGVLHRAITCLLFDDQQRLLFGRRALGKLLWPGYWDATVATHPSAGEDDLDAARRRVPEELGIEVTDLIRPAVISYHARYNAHWSERELCTVLLGRSAGTPTPVAGEIDDLIWVPRSDLEGFSTTRPVTPWFLLAWVKLQQDHADEFSRWLG
jgi:isopentenyl-diphosphate delta-isomerase